MQMQKVSAVLLEIESRFSDPGLSLTVIAKRFGLSPYHLSRTLMAFDGMGFGRRLHALRTRAARRLLIRSQLSVKEVAAAVGYRDAKHLCRHYRPRFGETPSITRSLDNCKRSTNPVLKPT